MSGPLSAPAYCRPLAYAAFAAEMPHVQSSCGLVRAACAIALHERPATNVREAEAILDNLAEVVRSRVHSPSVEAKLAHLHDVLFDLVGLRGNADDYYNPANSYVPEVLRTKLGLPITLSLIYKCVGEGVGLTIHGINAPGHFLTAVECPTRGTTDCGRAATNLMYVDPFYGGGLLTEADAFERIAETTGRDSPRTPELLSPATNRQWLERMLANLQAVFATLGRERDLLAMQELHAVLYA
jgi:regulator of sirC expression with transglutaminase-like and TPR domain